MPYFPFYGDVNKQRRNLASRLNIEYVPQEFNTSWSVRYKWVGKIAIKTKIRANSLISDVLVAVEAIFPTTVKQIQSQDKNNYKTKRKQKGIGIMVM